MKNFFICGRVIVLLIIVIILIEDEDNSSFLFGCIEVEIYVGKGFSFVLYRNIFNFEMLMFFYLKMIFIV